jgi:N-formylglutamate amidohydrolase
MDDSLQPGFSLTGDLDGRWPLVLASPHSGRDYPASFVAQSGLSLAQLRRAEDAHVDGLLNGVSGVPVLRARWARAYLDLNRAADELDAGMFDGLLTLPVRASERVAVGLGVLPRVAGHGLNIYRGRLPAAEAARRIAALHLPWHSRLTALLQQARLRHGHAVLIDCHSMPRPSGVRPPQVVVGDRHGTSAHPALVALVERHFADAGLRVARNLPYAGGYTTEHHGQPGTGIHAVQLEIDRGLYLDGTQLTPGPGFAAMQRLMLGLVRALLVAAPGLGLGTAWPVAAE